MSNSQNDNQSIIDMIKDNPLPAALIGLSVGLLAAGSATAATGSGDSEPSQRNEGGSRYVSGYSVPISEGPSSPDYIGAKSLPRPGQTTGASGNAHSSQSQGSSSNGPVSVSALNRWVEDYPLAVGAVTALIGAAVGLSMPGSRLEDEWMGEQSDHLIQEAKGTVTGAVEVAKETATQAVSSVQEEFQTRTASPEDLRENVKSSVKSAAETVTSEVKEAAKNVADTTKQTAKAEAEKRGLKPESS